jgi:hypothetical protein
MSTNLQEYGISDDVPGDPTDAKIPPPAARKLSELESPKPGDQTELLKNRFLCRGGGLLLSGPTGIGKSSFSMQATILWAIGEPCFGIVPARPLKSLLIQAENDDGDLVEFRNGICAGLNLTEEKIKMATDNVVVACENVRTSSRFFAEVVEPLLELHKPDLLWIDPALAYLGGDTASQRDVGAFLRNGLNPLLHRFGCAAVIVHHTNKPPTGKEKSNWQAGDFAYLGSGSAEWANWARAVLALRSIGSHELFELRAAKRGSRLGWKDADGSICYAKPIAHAKEQGAICWRETAPGEIEPAGRPKSFDPEEIFELLPPEGLSTGAWQTLVKSELGVSESTFHRQRREFVKAERILKSKVSGKWQPVQKR